jgi:hypothetical protein
LAGLPSDRPVRLLGLAGSSFESDSDSQQTLFDDDDAWSRVAGVVGDVEDRFGAAMVEPARLLDWEDTVD